MNSGVPQDSILGLLFIMYANPLSDILRQYNIYHMHANDTKLYVVSIAESLVESVRGMKQAIDHVKKWMTSNQLKLNTNKTEFLIIQTKHNKKD